MGIRRGRAAEESGEAGRYARLETRLGYRFGRAELLPLALTHRSFAYESRGVDTTKTDERTAASVAGLDNEQLEFLGDAVLGLVVAESLYKNFPQCSEGEMTRLRASLVSRKRMAEVGEELGLGEFLILGRSAEQVGGRRKPALLANAAEAVIAAIYLDGGLKAAQKLVERAVIAPEMAALRKALEGSAGGALRDHKTLLQERVQATGAGRLRYIDAGQTGPAHQRLFSVEAQLEEEGGVRVLASADGATKKEAQQKAAELALAGWVVRKETAAGEGAA
jgi:ribonuclease-3